jgi:arginyl-tRNA--protein-N-Asp/Glu arginylyltransferase
VPEQLITVEPVEADLTPERIDERLAEGWFPWGQRWMTCQAWPMEDGPRDTIWVRVRLAPRRLPDRWRRLTREGCTVVFHAEPVLDDEHQRLYERFRETRHPDWTKEAQNLLLHDDSISPLLAHTREIAVRDAGGRLCAFRWFLQGKVAIAGIASVYDTQRDGLGTIARALADRWATRSGFTWSYPGYVWPGAADTWYYKIKHGHTEWLHPEEGRWRAWDGDEPRPDDLVLAEMRRRLAQLGEVVTYGGWAAPCVDPSRGGLASPYFVIGGLDGNVLTVFVWNFHHRRYEELQVMVQREAEATTDEAAPVGPPE